MCLGFILGITVITITISIVTDIEKIKSNKELIDKLDKLNSELDDMKRRTQV